MKKYCPNCYYPLQGKSKFCAKCGQKTESGKVTMGDLLRRLWRSTFHLESKFFRTSWQLFVPGLVTSEFFRGKQARYPHPMRLFAVTMFFFLFVLNFLMKEKEEQRSGGAIRITTNDNGKIDTLAFNGDNFFNQLQHYNELDEFREDYDDLPEGWRTEEARLAFDSLLSAYAHRNIIGYENKAKADTVRRMLDTLDLNLITRQIRIASADAVRYSPEQIIQRYKISNWFDKIAVKQGIKSLKRPSELVHAYLGSLTWTLLALIAVMAGMLRLLYWKQQRFYVEHFLLVLHFHTGALLVLTASFIALRFKIINDNAVNLIALSSLIAMYFAMYHYYGQGWLMTFFKWLVYTIIYMVMFVLLFILGILLVFAIY
ncbi:MAG: DUF3667 domain-containing protein [Saprospiraceae bacterium]|nr:DUF3667 domain-containing protein [Saprospiraceae bacterium]